MISLIINYLFISYLFYYLFIIWLPISNPDLIFLLQISRQSIDACKNYFRDDLLKTDWQLMLELKNLFEIM